MKFSKAKKIVAAAMFGAFAISIPLTADARIHDPKVEAKVVSGDRHSNALTTFLDMVSIAPRRATVPEDVELFDDRD
ncbi:MAG: hypothetical protein J5497_00390, partial [Selenomonadaceae bacterium]|nr:hypothetical protein [Selenomonadaceae bacterium]